MGSQTWNALLKYSYQVVVAKNMGLQTLRLAGALVLPFNTTHYAFELANYLDRLVILLKR